MDGVTIAAVGRRSGRRGLAGPAGLRSGLRVAQPLNVSPADQVLASGPDRLDVAVLDPSADRHVAYAEFFGSALYGQQLALFHTADRTASSEQHNTLRGFTD